MLRTLRWLVDVLSLFFWLSLLCFILGFGVFGSGGGTNRILVEPPQRLPLHLSSVSSQWVLGSL
jgi:hypothetical protein